MAVAKTRPGQQGEPRRADAARPCTGTCCARACSTSACGCSTARAWRRSGSARMGHEAIQVAVGMNMEPGKDWLAPYYRDLALTLVLGMTPRDHLLSVLAKAEDPNSGGRQMPAHYGSRAHNIISTGSPVTTQLLHATGIALAMRMRGEDAVCVTAIGEGSTSGGDFHEALNFAATHKLARGVRGGEQRLRDQRPRGEADGHAQRVRPRPRVRHPRRQRRRQRRHRLLPRRPRRRAAGARWRGADAARGQGAPAHLAQLRRRPAPLPQRRGPRGRAHARTACRVSAPCSRTSACSRRATRTRCAPSWSPSSTRRPRTPSRPPTPSADTAMLHVYAEDELMPDEDATSRRSARACATRCAATSA